MEKLLHMKESTSPFNVRSFISVIFVILSFIRHPILNVVGVHAPGEVCLAFSYCEGTGHQSRHQQSPHGDHD